MERNIPSQSTVMNTQIVWLFKYYVQQGHISPQGAFALIDKGHLPGKCTARLQMRNVLCWRTTEYYNYGKGGSTKIGFSLNTEKVIIVTFIENKVSSDTAMHCTSNHWEGERGEPATRRLL